jgi:hypothetical protein
MALRPNAGHGLLILEVSRSHTTRTTVSRTPLDERSARRKDLYLTTHNKHNRQTSVPPVGFEPMISAGERPQTHALDRAATGTGDLSLLYKKITTHFLREPRYVSVSTSTTPTKAASFSMAYTPPQKLKSSSPNHYTRTFLRKLLLLHPPEICAASITVNG